MTGMMTDEIEVKETGGMEGIAKIAGEKTTYANANATLTDRRGGTLLEKKIAEVP